MHTSTTSNLRFIGNLPMVSLKLEWASGQARSLESIFEHVTASVKKGISRSDFNTWLSDFISDKDFLVENSNSTIADDEDGAGKDTEENEGGIVKPKVKGKKLITLESGSLKKATSAKNATENLRKMRHPDAVGSIERDPDNSIQTKDPIRQLVETNKLDSAKVTSGDDLQRGREVSKSTKKAGVIMLSEHGEPVTRIVNSKEEQALRNAESANLSKRHHVLTPELTREGSQVVSGSDEKSKAPSAAGVNYDPTKVNKYTQTQTSASVKREVFIQDLINEKDHKELSRLIGMCGDKSVLKMARVFHSDNGNQHTVEELEKRIRDVSKY